MPGARRRILAGDIGGTSTRLALFEAGGSALGPSAIEQYRNREHAGLGAIVARFRASHADPIDDACFGIAGPVIGGHVETPNLPWPVDAAALSREVGLARVELINDLVANAQGIFQLGPADFVTLNAGAAHAAGNVAVISAGTGLGEAGMYWDGQHHHPFAGEGGHADFAPHTDIEVELLRYLRRKLGGHVSWERVVSGPGLVNIYEFLRDTGHGAEPEWLRAAIAAGDPPAVIGKAGLEGRSDLCARALELLAAAYGAEAGNFALKVMATAGVYLGGGIAPKVLARLDPAGFMEAFKAKGRLRDLLERIPVRIITNEHTALLGAARHAALRASLIAPGAL
jgi:glucokinase